MKIIYIAGPYTNGDVAMNVKRAMDEASYLIKAGYAVIVPHLFHFQHMLHPEPYETWTAIDMELLKHAYAMIRIPGESKGADAEEEFARKDGIPVYVSTNDFIRAELKGGAE